MMAQRTRKPYPTDLSDAEWRIIEPLLPRPSTRRGRPRVHSYREILNAIFYVLRTGGAWRMLPHDFPPPGKRFITIFGSGGGMAPGNGFMTPCGVRFGWHQVARKSRKLPLWIANRSRRRKKGPRGYDAGKKVKGRKRHLLVDTLGLVLVAVVHAADIPDREGARWVLKKAWAAWPRLRRIWADGGYAGSLVRWVQPHAGGSLEIVRRQGKSKGFHVLPYRWIVERTFAWLGKYRRLSADIARGPQSTVSQNPKGILRKCELPVSGSNT